MKANLAAGASGLLFGLGLGVSGATQPARVTGFLDVAGSWDPTLVFVIAGAVAVHFVLFRLVRRLTSPVFDARFHLPTRRDLDAPLLAGAALFGIGWGLGGFCPGPALVSAATLAPQAIVFLVAMTAGMILHHATPRRGAAPLGGAVDAPLEARAVEPAPGGVPQ